MQKEVQRRLRLCNANVLDVTSARMYGGGTDDPPNFIRVFASQVSPELCGYTARPFVRGLREPQPLSLEPLKSLYIFVCVDVWLGGLGLVVPSENL